jgi:hypothetical protein
MKPMASRFALVLVCTILCAMGAVLTTSQPNDCRPLDCPRPHVKTAASTDARTPTLAPPPNVVFVRVESDQPDIRVSWAEN